MTTGGRVYIIVKEFIPADAPYNAQNSITVTAQFTYTNASPALSATHTRSDITAVGQASGAGLALVKSVDKSTALPGENLTYTVTYTNQSSSSLSSIEITDATPSFTTFVSAGYGEPLPLNITSCSVTSQPPVGSTGSIRWSLFGTFAPGGSSGTVTYTVQVQN